MKKYSKFIAVIMLIATLVIFAAEPAMAATSGGNGSYTIHVTTQSAYWYPGASSVTLKQNKQTATFKALLSSGTKTKTGYYGCYQISVYNKTTGKSKTLNWWGGQTYKVSLDGNCSYNITVTYLQMSTELNIYAPFGYYLTKLSNPYWKVSSTWKVSSWS